MSETLGPDWNNASLTGTTGGLSNNHGTADCNPHDGAISFVFIKHLETAAPGQTGSRKL